MKILDKAKEKFKNIISKKELLKENILIKARGLSTKETIGNPEHYDFPLLEGNEVMIQAKFAESYGQAFTDCPGNFQGSLQEIIELPLDDNYRRALMIAAINAVLRALGLAEKTVHCKDQEPELCACKIVNQIMTNSNDIEKIGIIGYQPAILDRCVNTFTPQKIILTDLNEKKIGRKKYGVEVWDGNNDNEALIRGSELILFTGSSIVNDSIDGILKIIYKYNKKYFIYGNTISGVASLLNLSHLCFYGH